MGTLSGGEGGHLHICLSDKEGKVIGGHVIGDLIIFTTAEVVIGECEAATFQREICKLSGWGELVVVPRRQGYTNRNPMKRLKNIMTVAVCGGLLLSFLYSARKSQY
jgi:hypothetical protein